MFIKRGFLKQVALLILSVFAFNAFAPGVAMAASNFQIPAGTSVLVKPVKAVSPKEYHVGDLVEMIAVSDVVLQDQIVIKAGSLAQGEVTVSERKGIVGKPAKIGITLRSVQAVDGKTIPLSGTKTIEGKDNVTTALVIGIVLCVFGLFINGEDAVISDGATISGTVLTPVTISI